VPLPTDHFPETPGSDHTLERTPVQAATGLDPFVFLDASNVPASFLPRFLTL
jgi:hypothetical protein